MTPEDIWELILIHEGPERRRLAVRLNYPRHWWFVQPMLRRLWWRYLDWRTLRLSNGRNN